MRTIHKALTITVLGAGMFSAVNAATDNTPATPSDTNAEPRYSDYLYRVHHGEMGYKARGSVHGMNFGADIHHLDVLDLSEAQREQIDAIDAQFNEELAQLQLKRDKAAAELPTLYAAEVPDPEAIGSAYGAIFDAKRERIQLMIGTRNRVLEVLTDEQRIELDQFNYSGTEKRVQS